MNFDHGFGPKPNPNPQWDLGPSPKPKPTLDLVSKPNPNYSGNTSIVLANQSIVVGWIEHFDWTRYTELYPMSKQSASL